MKACQSCGMPMNRDPQGGGTDEDGCKNEKYCSYCYQDGVFACAEMTVDEFQEFTKTKMVEHGAPKIFAWFFTRGMKRLERWNKKHGLDNALVEKYKLTPRECEVIEATLQGKTDKEIAIALNMAVNTVQTHLKRIYKKTGAAGRFALSALVRGE